ADPLSAVPKDAPDAPEPREVHDRPPRHSAPHDDPAEGGEHLLPRGDRESSPPGDRGRDRNDGGGASPGHQVHAGVEPPLPRTLAPHLLGELTAGVPQMV